MTGAFLLLLCLGGNIYTDIFERGNAAYAEGAMADAVTAYEQLMGSGVQNPEVFYNLASAQYHFGDLGRAVLNYERALGLNPHFDAARRALTLAVSETEHQFDRPGRFALEGVGGQILGLPSRALRGAVLVIWWLLWGILAAKWRNDHRVWTKAAAVVWGLIVTCAIILALPVSRLRAAVVVAPETPARYGPQIDDGTRMTLAPGDRVVVDRSEQGWARVELADGRRGWVDERSLAYAGPPFDTGYNERE